MIELWKYSGLWQPNYLLCRLVPIDTFIQVAKVYNIYKIQTISLKPNFHKIMARFFQLEK